MLFILALEPLQRLLDLAEQNSALSPISSRATKIRISLYADDAAVFVNPIKEEIDTVRIIFETFEKVSGLNINIAKSVAYPI